MKNIIDALNWRYATQKFDTSKKLTDEQVQYLTDSVRLAPSAFGLQPFKILVITNPEIRAKLQAAGYGQPKISEASHLFVFAAVKNVDEAYIEKQVELTSQVRGVPMENLGGYRDMMTGAMQAAGEAGRRQWAARQAYLGLGSLIAAASLEGIDTGPMEGFDPKQFDEILGLEAKGLETVVICALGYRSAEDPNAAYKKVRQPTESFVHFVK